MSKKSSHIKSIQRRIIDNKVDLIDKDGKKIGTISERAAKSILRTKSSKKKRNKGKSSSRKSKDNKTNKSKRHKTEKSQKEETQLSIDF